MQYSSLRITYSPLDPYAGRSIWVRLEQIIPPEWAKFVSLSDVYQLWLAASLGRSAQTLRAIGCPVEFIGDEVHVLLGFYAWPSDPALVYSLGSAIGTLSERTVVRKPRQFSAFVDNSNKLDLDFFMEDISVTYETPCFNQYGAEISPPTITKHSTWIEFSTEVFAAVRISGKAVGVSCICEMVLTRPMDEEPLTQEEINEAQIGPGGEIIWTPGPTTRQNGYKVENLENTITASWLSAEGTKETDELRLEIPQCVQDILKFCPDMYQTILLWCNTVRTHRVYFNACTGDIMFILDGPDPQTYCSRTIIPGTSDDNPYWLPNPGGAS